MDTIWIEECRTPIYERIARSLGVELARLGKRVMIVKPSGFDTSSFSSFISQINDGVYISTNESNAIHQKDPVSNQYFFESLKRKIVFVHQDSVLNRGNYSEVLSKLSAFQRIADRSTHLCIEPTNTEVLRSIGIPAATVAHATEITARPPIETGFDRSASFVGHVIPSWVDNSDFSDASQQFIRSLAEKRTNDASLLLEPCFEIAAQQSSDPLEAAKPSKLDIAAQRLWLRGQVHTHSLAMRGRLIEKAGLEEFSIYGGDPAYLHGVERSLRISQPGISYYPAIYDPKELLTLYARTAVNVNITALQFDAAVINRFLDVVMAGGLCVTDSKQLLPDLTRHHSEVSYRTPQELKERIVHFSSPSRARERTLLIREIQKDIAARQTTSHLANAVLSADRLSSEIH